MKGPRIESASTEKASDIFRRLFLRIGCVTICWNRFCISLVNVKGGFFPAGGNSLYDIQNPILCGNLNTIHIVSMKLKNANSVWTHHKKAPMRLKSESRRLLLSSLHVSRSITDEHFPTRVDMNSENDFPWTSSTKSRSARYLIWNHVYFKFVFGSVLCLRCWVSPLMRAQKTNHTRWYIGV